MKIADIMTKQVVTVSPETDIHTLAQLFIDKDISGAPVVDKDNKFIGLVLEEGVIFQDKNVHLPTFINLSMGFITLGANRYEQEIKRISASKVSDIMEKEISVISPYDSVEKIATMMIEKGVHYYPVLEGNNLVGIVTKKDIIRVIAQEKI